MIFYIFSSSVERNTMQFLNKEYREKEHNQEKQKRYFFLLVNGGYVGPNSVYRDCYLHWPFLLEFAFKIFSIYLQCTGHKIWANISL